MKTVLAAALSVALLVSCGEKKSSQTIALEKQTLLLKKYADYCSDYDALMKDGDTTNMHSVLVVKYEGEANVRFLDSLRRADAEKK